MGFNKRIVTKESILVTKEEHIDTIFNADALMMDKWASRFLQLHMKGHKKNEIIKMLEDEFKES